MALDGIIYNLGALIPFFIQLATSEVIFLCKQKRKSMFLQRLLSCLICSIFVIFLSSAVLFGISTAKLYMLGTISYLLLFFFSFCCCCFLLDEKPSTVMFCLIAAYALQNLSYRVCCIFEASGVIYKLAVAMQNNYQGAYSIINTIVFAGVYAVGYFVFAKYMQKIGVDKLKNVQLFSIAALTLSVTVVLCAIVNFYWYESVKLAIINYAFSILLCAVILCLQSGLITRGALKQDLQNTRSLWERDRQRYKTAADDIEIINIKCHDLKHKLRALQTVDESFSGDVAELNGAVSDYACVIDCGCAPLDVLLSECALHCKDQNIAFSVMADGSGLKDMNISNVYSLFGNILDNAINAASSCAGSRYIDASIKNQAGMTIIKVKNSYEGKIEFSGGLPKSSRGAGHGFGMKSIKRIVDGCGGTMECKADHSEYSLSICLPNNLQSK